MATTVDAASARESAVARNVQLSNEVLIRRARANVNVFMEYVFRMKQQRFHRELQNFFNAQRYATADAPVEHGKTTQVSIGRTCWFLGNDVSLTQAIVSNTAELPEMALTVIHDTITTNERFARVFPWVKVTKFGRTKTGNMILQVERPSSMIKDPSVVAIGINGNIIGRRWGRLVTDDIQDFYNTFSEGERTKLFSILQSTVLQRLLLRGVHEDVGTPWVSNDARCRLRKMKGYNYRRWDATDLLWDEITVDPGTGQEFGWTKERLEQKRLLLTQLEFDRQFRCLAMSGSLKIFDPDVLDTCKRLGRGMRLGWQDVHPETVVVTGVDLAVGKKETNDEVAMMTVALESGKKRPVDMRKGRWQVRKIVGEMVKIVDRFPQHRGFMVENNSAQDYLLQVANDVDMVRSVASEVGHEATIEQILQRISIDAKTTTAVVKHDPILGVRGMAADFEHGKWIIPCDEHLRCDDIVQQWIDGLIAFDPLSHTDDMVMASWFASEEAKRFGTGRSIHDKVGAF